MSKLESDRHPFFSRKREFFEALVRDKIDRKQLGREVKRKTADYIRELRGRVEDAECKAQRFERRAKETDYLENIIRNAGINISRWNWQNDLEKVLKNGMPLGTERNIENAIQILQQVLNSIKEKEETKEVG